MLHSEINVREEKDKRKQSGFNFITTTGIPFRVEVINKSQQHCICFKSKLHVREEMEKWKQSSFNFITITRITFRVEVKDKVPGRKKKTKKTKETMRGTKKEVCDVCGTKPKSGHVRCELCGQWKHVKCVGKTFTELKKGYKCPTCKGTEKSK